MTKNNLKPIICDHCGKEVERWKACGCGKSHACPICDGTGQVLAGFYIIGNSTTGFSTPETCRSCCGVGIVWEKQ